MTNLLSCVSSTKYEMCILNIGYSVEGNRTLDTSEVYSVDPRFVHCFESESSQLPGMAYNNEGHSEFSGQLTDNECMILGQQ